MPNSLLHGRAGSELHLEQIPRSRLQTAQLVSAQGTTVRLRRSGPLLGGMLVELWHVAVLRSVKGFEEVDWQSWHLLRSSEQSAQAGSVQGKTLLEVRSGPKPCGISEVSRHELLLSNRYFASAVGLHRVQRSRFWEQTWQFVVEHSETSLVEKSGPLPAGMSAGLWQVPVDRSMNFFGLVASHAAQVR